MDANNTDDYESLIHHCRKADGTRGYNKIEREYYKSLYDNFYTSITGSAATPHQYHPPLAVFAYFKMIEQGERIDFVTYTTSAFDNFMSHIKAIVAKDKQSAFIVRRMNDSGIELRLGGSIRLVELKNENVPIVLEHNSIINVICRGTSAQPVIIPPTTDRYWWHTLRAPKWKDF